MTEFHCVVPGKPIPQGRPRKGKGNHWYYPPASAAYRDLLVLNFRAAGVPEQPFPQCMVFLEVYGANPSADPDNLAKNVMDALVTARIIKNDNVSVVRRLLVDSHPSRGVPGLEVQVTPIGESCPKQKKKKSRNHKQ